MSACVKQKPWEQEHNIMIRLSFCSHGFYLTYAMIFFQLL